MQSTLSAVRVVHVVLFISLFLYLRVAEQLVHHEPRDLHGLWYAFLVVALANFGLTLYVRSKVFYPAANVLRVRPDDPDALTRWRMGNIVSSLTAATIMLYGFGLRFSGGSRMQALPFYNAAFILILVWWPRRP